ncbi:hypothetical protein [Sphingomonas sp.]|jgi:hypothetical protein|uniref:hypothetical protein n=1 Tax=Sphingomonas sp. TaxID=28214 RepID=UPI002D80B07C|nr:hypothetical protein [Sphingomonas sp.]HEU0045185.1 hypothetical protein [Sphingomonas sp.]
MKRILICLAALSFAGHAAAQESDYGPAKRWKGIGYKFGYEDEFAKDGVWRVKARTRRGDGVDMAVYRAAERAREAGYPYVQFLGGKASRGPGLSYAELDVLPSRSPAAPTACRSKKPGTCYTADVAAVLRRLSGDSGFERGVAVTDHIDRYGRRVIYSGFGAGAVVATARPAARVGAVQLVPMPVPMPVLTLPIEPSASERQAAALRAAQPVRGRETKQGWTVSD